jgi:hypothetical protein
MLFILELSDSDFENKGWKRPLTLFQFDITPLFEYDSVEWWDWDDNVLMGQVGKMEEYGVHDYTAGGDNDGNWTEFGYHSYEIRQHQWDEVIQKWHDWFASQGFNPGEITLSELEDELEDE